MHERVQIPAYSDRWMMGDRYGTIQNVFVGRRSAGVRAALLSGTRGSTEIAVVKLDKSGKTVRVILADCTLI